MEGQEGEGRKRQGRGRKGMGIPSEWTSWLRPCKQPHWLMVFMTPQSMMQRRRYVSALFVVPYSSRPLPNIVATRFAGILNRFREVTITTNILISDYILGEIGKEQGSRVRENIRVDVNRFCRGVEQVLSDAWRMNSQIRLHRRWQMRSEIFRVNLKTSLTNFI